MQVAVKIPKVDDLTQDKIDEFRAELKVMARIVHPRVVALLGAFIPSGTKEELFCFVVALSNAWCENKKI